MAHSNQAKKRVRQTVVETERNRARKSRLRTFIRRAEEVISSGNKEEIPSAFTAAMSEMARAVKKGVMKKGTAARKTSRLAAKIKAQS